jgi:flagellar protein FliO/FliZ
MGVEDWLRTAAGLVLTLGLIGLAALALRKFGMLQPQALGAPRRMRVVETLFLDPRRKVVLVRVDDAEHLLLLSPFGDRALGQAEAAPAASPAEPAP